MSDINYLKIEKFTIEGLGKPISNILKCICNPQAFFKTYSIEAQIELEERQNKLSNMRLNHNQQNMLINADSRLDNKTPAENHPSPQLLQFTHRCITASEDIYDEDILSLYSKILAGEINKPGTYSLRVLDILQKMNRSDLLQLEKFFDCCVLLNTEGNAP